jgi:hypothetical protein
MDSSSGQQPQASGHARLLRLTTVALADLLDAAGAPIAIEYLSLDTEGRYAGRVGWHVLARDCVPVEQGMCSASLD